MSAIQLQLNEHVRFGNDLPFVLIGGMNVLESAELADEVAQAYVTVTKKLGMPLSLIHI